MFLTQPRVPQEFNQKHFQLASLPLSDFEHETHLDLVYISSNLSV